MTRSETNKKNMGKGVAGIFNKKPEALTNFPYLKEPVEKLNGILNDITTVETEYEKATDGTTASKQIAEEDLLEELIPVKSGLYSLGVKTGNQAIKELTNYSEWDLKKMRDPAFVTKAQSIKDEAAKQLTGLALYNITAETLTELQAKIDAFNSGIENQGTGVTSRSAYKKKLHTLFDALDDVLVEELDELIELVKKHDKLLYDQYDAARGIKDLGGRKKGSGGDTGNTTPTPPAQ
jgi:hypothetical protein